MGFFGVIAEDGAALKVRRFDVNLWCLPGRALRRFGFRFFCDIGIEIESTSSLSHLTIALPFTTTGAITDLSPMLQGRSIASLVFGEPVNVLHDDYLEIGQKRLRLIHLNTVEPPAEHAKNSANFSMCKLPFLRPSRAGESAYVRVRFRIGSLGRLWVWHPTRGGGRAAVIDVRVSDPREAAVLGAGSEYADSLLPIDRVNCFVMVPIEFEHRFCSPEVRYLRLLEGDVWAAYLPPGSLRHRLLVHYWRKEDVRVGSEFRGLLNVRSTPPMFRASQFLSAAGAAMLVVLLLAPQAFNTALDKAMPAITYAATNAKALIVVGVTAAVGWMIGNLDTTRATIDYLRRRLRKK